MCCAEQSEEDAYTMFSPYVGTNAVPTEITPAVEEEADGPSWFLVVRASAPFTPSLDKCHWDWLGP